MPIQRIPLSQPIETRDGTLTQDSKCVNGYFETRDVKREFIKRPGLAIQTVTPALPSDQGQGMYLFKGNLYTVVNNTLYKIDTTTWASTTVGTITGPIKTCYFTQTLDDGYLFLHNQLNGYLVNGATGAFTQITNDKVASVTILTGGSGYVSGDTVVFSAPPSGTTATGTLQLTSGVVTGIVITDPGSGYVTAPTISITTSTGSGFAGQPVLNFFPTTGLVPGVAFLDSYIVVGTISGRVYTSNVGDPTTWNPLDYITAEAEPDLSTGITKHLNYILDFGQWSTEFFYDQGNYPGSPLANSPSYSFEIGCANGNSIVAFENIVLWVGTAKTTGVGVYGLDGTAPGKVSTVYIDRILENSNLQTVTAYAFRFNGHPFYVLTLHDLNVTIVYDVSEKMWHQWTMWAIGDEDSGVPGIYAEQYFRPSYYSGDGLSYYLLDDDNGTLYTLSDNNYNDAGAPIYYRAVTDLIDNGTTKRKFYNRVEIIGDKVGATMNIRHTDDDYQSWSPYRSVNLNASRSQIYQTGASRRRAWEFLCTDNAPLRLDAAEMDFDIGELEGGGPAPTTYRR